jgi:ketosteroid isomerase-like protein
MKTKISKGLLFLVLMSLVIACKPKTTEPAIAVIDSEQVKKEIQAKENEFADTYNAGQMKNIGYYADDATSFAQNSPALVGKTAIVEYLKANVDTKGKTNKISFETREVFPSNDGNQVVEIGYYKVVNAENTLVNSGNYMVLFVKRDGKYYSLRDMSTSDMPVQ